MYREVATNLGNPAQTIDQIGSFAQLAGWTIVANVLTGSNRTLTLRKSGDFVVLSNTSATAIKVQTSVSQGSDFAPFSGNANLGAGPYAKLYCFADTVPTEHVHIVMELSAGLVRMLSFGELEKMGVWTGGTYCDASYWATSTSYRGYWNTSSHALFSSDYSNSNSGGLRVHVDGLRWANFYTSSNNNYWRADTGWSADGNSKGYVKSHLDLDLNVHDQRRIGRPIKVGIQRPGGLISPAGFFPGVRAIRVDTFNFGEERPDPDGTAWKVFPLARKGAPPNPNDSNDDYSGVYGLAFRKTA